MILWLILGATTLVFVLTGATLFLLWTRLLDPMKILDERSASHAQLSVDLANTQNPLLVEIRDGLANLDRRLDELPQRIVPLLDRAVAQEAQTGMFVPSDEVVAQMEREMAVSEGHFIPSNAPRFSPLHSSGSGNSSGRGSSSRARRNSGSR